MRVVAYRLGNKHLSEYASEFSRKDRCTLPQLFACRALREFYHLSYRRTEALLTDTKDLCRAVRITSPPDHNTPCDACGRLCKIERFAPMMDELAVACACHLILSLWVGTGSGGVRRAGSGRATLGMRSAVLPAS